MKYSVIIPVYKNESSISRLLQVLESMNQSLSGQMEAVFVIDGSPDQSYNLIKTALPTLQYNAKLVAHTRPFGLFSAIRTGLESASGQYYAIMGADLQDPPGLILEFFKTLENNECEVVIGARSSRDEPIITRLTTALFWRVYSLLVIREMPSGGVDVFGCNERFKTQLLALEESRSSLFALIFWLGFKRKIISYKPIPRKEGRRSETISKKLDYMMDSMFAFTDLPIRLLFFSSSVGSFICSMLALTLLGAHFTKLYHVPDVLPIVLGFFLMGTLNLFCFGLVGTYAWRAYENSKRRPLAVVASIEAHEHHQPHEN